MMYIRQHALTAKTFALQTVPSLFRATLYGQSDLLLLVVWTWHLDHYFTLLVTGLYQNHAIEFQIIVILTPEMVHSVAHFVR